MFAGRRSRGPSGVDRSEHLDALGHHIDPNRPTPYDVGPSNRDYISDPTHPDYDPAIDPSLQLRTVRTAAESIAESHRSEARREARQKARRRGGSILNKLGRGKSFRKTANSQKQQSVLAGLIEGEFAQNKHSAQEGSGLRNQYDAEEDDDDEEDPEDVDAAAVAGPAAAATTAADSGPVDTGLKGKKRKPQKRRNVYVNMPLAANEANKRGDPLARYARNKVRTSKYTIITFLPRFLGEQFRRIANVYFLLLVVLQIFPMFGATLPQIAMLPLVTILTVTAIKDIIEDYRRHVLDNQVNNSAVTKLGAWRNVNQPREARGFFARLLGIDNRNKVSKGVRKLREKEDAIGMRQVSGQSGPAGAAPANVPNIPGYIGGQKVVRPQTGGSLSSAGGFGQLETIASESERGGGGGGSVRAGGLQGSMSRATSSTSVLMPQGANASVGQFGDYSTDRVSASPTGVVDYRRATPGTARWERTLWKKLEVGDVVLLRENDQIPADIVLLNCSDPDGNAYVETKNLDGETNLKVRKCLKATMGIQTEEDIEHARFVIDSEPPHANLYAYNALLKYWTSPDESGSGGYFKDAPPDSSAAASAEKQSQLKMEPVTANELLLRGCALRNTEWVIGLVVMTGKDTKIMLNGGETPSKRSNIEKETNINVAVNFVILMLMCLTCAIAGGWYDAQTTSRTWYAIGSSDSSSHVVVGLVIFCSSLIVFQNIVPISLYISIELTKTIAAFFIYQDIDMYYAPLDHPCVPKTWGIVDDLGQIEYIFSDKTGTLTQNVMEFKKCSVGGTAYGEGVTEAMIGAMKREGKDTSAYDPERMQVQLDASRDRMVDTLNRTFKNRYLRPDRVTLISPAMADDLSPTKGEQRKALVSFWRAIALCHTALADRPDASNPYLLEYKAQSPDEAALVAAARDAGAVFINKNNNAIDIEVMGNPERYTPLNVLEFNSTRKRMSVIVREPDGRILMISKGADSVIFQRLAASHDKSVKDVIQKDLEDFANAGLRTLCIAYRYIEEREYVEWARLYDAAAATLVDRDDAIDEACEKIEYDLTLLGATALEDKLQVGVPETIEKLSQAGIKIWVLTGDKLQTAIEIGFSCNLLSSDMDIMIISADHEQGTRAQIEAACNKIAAAGRPVVVEGEKAPRFGHSKRASRLGIRPEGDVPKAFSVVIDGETLRFALDPALKGLFLALTCQVETVICCRVSPAQKALVVRLVKEGKKAMTLSIGDGANDVSMIQEASVGVGIAGLEGAQASMSADYAIGQFRYLGKLLLVHGHWNTYRIGLLHRVFFYKNIIWSGALFIFQIYTQFNATYLFDYTLVLLYNLVFTSLPVIILGALDQDLRAPALMAFPQTYAPGREGKLYTRGQFWMACLDGGYQAAVCMLLGWALWNYFPIVNADGLSLDPMYALGTTVAASVVLSANFYCAMHFLNWTWIVWVVLLISNLSFFVWIFVYSAPFFNTTYSGTAYALVTSVSFWATIVLSIIACMLPRYAANAWQACFRPEKVDIVRQAWIKGDLKRRLGVASSKRSKRNEAGRQGGSEDDDLEDSQSHYHDTREQQRQSLTASHRDESYARQQREREHSNESVNSNSPLPAGDYDARRSSRQQRASLGPNDVLGGGAAGGPRADTAMSFYDPEQLPRSFSNTPEPTSTSHSSSSHHHASVAPRIVEPYRDDEDGDGYDARGAAASGAHLPQIVVERPSMNEYRYGANEEAATSRTALASASVDSFEQHFQTAFADERRGHGGSQPHHRDQQTQYQEMPASPPRGAPITDHTAVSTMSPMARFHNRFGSPPRDALAASRNPYSADMGTSPTPRQTDFAPQPLPPHHPRDDSNMTQASWHTASNDDAPRR